MRLSFAGYERCTRLTGAEPIKAAAYHLMNYDFALMTSAARAEDVGTSGGWGNRCEDI